jgi:hypothetical protein
MSPLVVYALLPVLSGYPSGYPSVDEILAAVARTSMLRHEAEYSGVRQYSIHNVRFEKSALVTVQIAAKPKQGKQFTIVSRSGCGRLIDVVEKLLSSEAEASRPNNARGHEIGPANYYAFLKGAETVASRECWVLSLKPKMQNKYLIEGTAWVDKSNYALVRLEGKTASSVSLWVGTPHIVEDFAPVDGIWLPMHTVSRSRSALLGESSLDIRYSAYDVKAVVKSPEAAPLATRSGTNPQAIAARDRAGR